MFWNPVKYVVALSLLEAIMLSAVAEGLEAVANQSRTVTTARNERALNADEKALAERVFGEYPDLRDGNLADWEAVSLLRQWAWSNTRLSGVSNLLETTMPEWVNFPAPKLYQTFQEDKGGVYCSGAALALERLYGMFGYEAYSLHLGRPGPTHVLTLVRICVDGEMLFAMQDAYFNLSYADANSGEPLDVLEMTRRLKQGRHASITVIDPDPATIKTMPSYLVAPEDHPPPATKEGMAHGAFCVQESTYTFEELADGTWKFTSPRLASKFVNVLCADGDGKPIWYRKFLVDQGHPDNMLYYFLYANYIYPQTPTANRLLEQAKAIVAGPA